MSRAVLINMWKLVVTVYISSLVICKAQNGTTTVCPIADPVCPNVYITFWLYSNSTQNSPFQLTVDNFMNAPYKNNASFVLLIHGYKGSKDATPIPELRKALFNRDEYNIISVDYAPVAKEPCYTQAYKSSKTVANCTARLFLEMINNTAGGINIGNFHVIGFSLGAQIAGIMGYNFKSWRNMTIKRMTGLDPALPGFESASVDSRISPDDAVFVDVYHTCAGSYGIVNPAGDVDFYLNKGYAQPGCGINIGCSHLRSGLYYAESINQSSIGFWGAPCTVSQTAIITSSDICKSQNGQQTTVLMGYYTPNTTTGTYKVVTNSTPPFALGKNPNVSTSSIISG